METLRHSPDDRPTPAAALTSPRCHQAGSMVGGTSSMETLRHSPDDWPTPAAGLPSPRCYQAGSMAGGNPGEEQAVWNPCGPTEDMQPSSELNTCASTVVIDTDERS